MSTFNPSLKNILDWFSLLQMSNSLLLLDTYLTKNLGQSIPKQAYWVLSGLLPDPSTVEGQAWETVRTHADFKTVVDSCVDDYTQVNAVLHLTNIFMDNFVKSLGKVKPVSEEEITATEEHAAEVVEDVTTLILGCGEDETELAKDEMLTDVLLVVVSKVDLKVGDLLDLNIAMFAMFGLFASTEYQTPTEKMRQWEDLRQHVALSKFVELCGNLKEINDAALRDSRALSGVTINHTPGAFGRNTRNSEKLGVAAKNPLVLAKFGDNTFSNRERQDVRAAGQGDLVLICDESGSMQEGNDPLAPRLLVDKVRNQSMVSATLEQVNKARGKYFSDNLDKDAQCFNLEVAMAGIATSRGRKVTALRFDAGQIRQFRYAVDSYASWLDYSKIFFGGGTTISRVLEQALDGVKNRHTDIVILTDGYIGDDPTEFPTVAKKLSDYKANGGVVWVVYIGSSHGDVPWATYTIDVKDLMASDGNLYKLFKSVGTDRSEGRRSL